MADPDRSTRVRDIARALKRIAPAAIIAVVDGEDVHVALTSSRGKWDRAAETIVNLGASSVRLLDDSGRVLDVLALDDGERAPAAPTAPRGESRDAPADVERLLRAALEAQDVATQRLASVYGETLRAAIDIMRAASARAEALDRLLLSRLRERERELDAIASEIENSKSESSDGTIEKMLALAASIGSNGKQS